MGIIGALIIALFVALLFSPVKNKDSVAPLLVLFLVLFFAGFAAQLWIIPFGPVLWGVSWLPIFFIVIIFALLFSTTPPSRKAIPLKDIDYDPSAIAMSTFIIILLLILAIAIVAGVYRSEFN